MAQLLLGNNIDIKDDSDADDNINNQDDMNNYRGYFHNEEEPEERYFEWGAHFPYLELCRKLDEVMRSLSPSRRAKTLNETVEKGIF